MNDINIGEEEVSIEPLSVCLECGRLQCNELIECTSKCSNTVFVDNIDEIEKCTLCEKFSHTIDMQSCFKCQVRICLRCNWEANYRNYCEGCITNCEFCGLNTTFYKRSVWSCTKCGEVACKDCLNKSDICPNCESS